MGPQRLLVIGGGPFPGGKPDHNYMSIKLSHIKLYLPKHLLFFIVLPHLVSFMILTMTLVAWQGRYYHSNKETGIQIIGFT